MCTFGEFEPDPKLLMELLPLPRSPTTLTRLWKTAAATTSSYDALAATARHALAHGAASLRTGLQASLRRGGGGAFSRGMRAPWPPSLTPI
jgi:hypothetical protein